MLLEEIILAETLPESESFELIPEGWYNAMITKATASKTKSGTGSRLSIMFQIVGEKQNGRCVFGNINYQNENEVAERIGRMQLGDIMRSLMIERLADTDELINAPICVNIKTSKKQDGYDQRSEAVGFKPFQQSPIDMPAQKPFPAHAHKPQEQARATAPWVKR